MNCCPTVASPRPRAFLRWAGGKTWLVPRIKSLFGELEFNRYHEPFLGGGSFFFAAAGGANATLSDKNDALIETYASIRSNYVAALHDWLMLDDAESIRQLGSTPSSHAAAEAASSASDGD